MRFSLTGPPSAVVNLTVAYRNGSRIKVTWSRPVDLGGRTDLFYNVDCVGCDEKVKFLPGQTGLHSTRCAAPHVPDLCLKTFVFQLVVHHSACLYCLRVPVQTYNFYYVL